MSKTAVISLGQVTRFKLELDRHFPDQATLLLEAPPIDESSYNQSVASMMLVKQCDDNGYPYQHTSTNAVIVRNAAKQILQLQGIFLKEPISQDMEYAKP